MFTVYVTVKWNSRSRSVNRPTARDARSLPVEDMSPRLHGASLIMDNAGLNATYGFERRYRFRSEELDVCVEVIHWLVPVSGLCRVEAPTSIVPS